MSEFLTACRYAEVVEIRKRLGVKECWTMDGKVVVVGGDGTKKEVRSVNLVRRGF